MIAATRQKPSRYGAGQALLRIPAWSVRALIRLYRYTLSSLVGRTCRHLPTCSEYAEEAIARHGLWAGAWMGLARFWRCRPFGTSGFDPPPAVPPAGAAWHRPWRYGRWRSIEPLQNPHRIEGAARNES